MRKMQPDLVFLKALWEFDSKLTVNGANQTFHPKCIKWGGHRLEQSFLKQWHVCDLSWSSFTRASNNVVTGWQHLPRTDLQNARLGAWLIYMQTAMRRVDRHIYHGQTGGGGYLIRLSAANIMWKWLKGFLVPYPSSQTIARLPLWVLSVRKP